MTPPFRNTDKVPAIYPAHSIVSIFDRIEDAEALEPPRTRTPRKGRLRIRRGRKFYDGRIRH